MEDNIYLSKGVLVERNAQLVSRAAELIRGLGAQLATTSEAREMLAVGPPGVLPVHDHVAARARPSPTVSNLEKGYPCRMHPVRAAGTIFRIARN
ncbi:3-keto-5-aminohexanoate cleavage protein [Rhizobium gallicum]|uniref:3-keto-5-aminohexanoate cleavage protein n=1 Tax=Rhizobium gallicum TaxID=56730 RepID=UPI0009E57943